jgi:peptide/nickel transport system permease protein
LVERQKDYVAAAKLVGRGPIFIMARQLLPNVLNPIFVLATLDIAFAIMSEATLSFLGFGMPATQPSLGTLIKIGYGYLFSGEWWVAIFPGLTLMILLVAINIFGDWVRDMLDPRLR